ncbi:MAG: hypothetical protein NTX82_01575 [Candidatus Parcubacteria bacterium]|nr:hypothetical protein [Candidatus Parcubacteria bacterium]
MKIQFNQKFRQNPDFLIKRCGYGLVRDFRATEVSYSRRLGNGIYPRFHMYINSEDPLVLNLHIDQKQASYQGTTAHSGDYDSDYVKTEAQRIYNQIISVSQEISEEQEEPESKGFWSSLFGR